VDSSQNGAGYYDGKDDFSTQESFLKDSIIFALTSNRDTHERPKFPITLDNRASALIIVDRLKSDLVMSKKTQYCFAVTEHGRVWKKAHILLRNFFYGTTN
jgi:hypothetical protein